MSDKNPRHVDVMVELLIDLWKKGLPRETLEGTTRTYLMLLKMSGDEKGYNELIPKILKRQREEIER